MITGEIERRFHSSTFTFYTKVEVVLEKVAIGEEVPADFFSEIIDHFQDDLEETELQTELRMLKNAMHAQEYSLDALKENASKYRQLLPQTARLLQLLLVMPATSATSERLFSSLRHIKHTFARLYMKKERVNNLMMLYIHKDRKIDIAEAMREFISRNSEGVVFFGKLYNNFIDIIA